MKSQKAILIEWDFPHLIQDGVALIYRKDWEDCVRKIFDEGCQIWGYLAFDILEDDRIQLNLERVISWSNEIPPTFNELVEQFSKIPAYISYLEFHFSVLAE